MILENIHTSVDIKKLDQQQVLELNKEIREFLIKEVAKTGGHLAANLGVVELTVALHRVFDVEKDRLVWDVGHQSYTHKILTGRADRFSTLRQFGGLSGFPKSEESCADAFNTGHSSTSISAATGFAVAAKLKGEKSTAVAIIGDGALTGGMAFEALDHAGAMKIPLVVVLNDNGMSISKNVGSLSLSLKKIRNTRKYFEFKTNLKSTLDRIHIIGPPLKRLAIKVKMAIKRMLLPNMFFEDFGFTYLGPVDGHNVKDLEVLLQRAKEENAPVLVHVHTKKGKGYLPAEKNPDIFHGVSGFDFKTGQASKGKKKDWSTHFGEVLCNMAIYNQKLVAITAAMPLGTGLAEFKKRFPNRFFDVGIAEQHAVTFAAGLAKGGLVPCFAVYSTFLQRAYDQLLHDVALQNLHVVFCIDRSGPVGKDGETHQGVFDISYISHMPNFTILSPSDEKDFNRMLEYAVTMCQGPVAIRYPRGLVPETSWDTARQTPVSSSVRRDGSDALICATGVTVYDAMEAAEILEQKGISTAVLDIGGVKPLDKTGIISACNGKKVIFSLEDNVKIGGIGQQIECLIKRDVNILAYPDEPIVQGDVRELKIKYGLSAEQIARAVAETIASEV